MTQDRVLPSVFKRVQSFSRPLTPTHERKEEAIAPLARGPAEGERPPVFILSRQPAGQGLVGGSQQGVVPEMANGWVLAGCRALGDSGKQRQGPDRHPLVVASPRDSSVLVAAFLHLVLESTATGLGQQAQLRFSEHIWGGGGQGSEARVLVLS